MCADRYECDECDECANPIDVDGQVSETIYNTPWSEGRTVSFCGDRCKEDFMEGSCDFPFMWCESCERYVCYRNPANGYRVQFHLNDEDFQCMSCYQEDLLKNGQPESDFTSNNIGGGDFFSTPELVEAGYKPVEEWQDIRITTEADCANFNARATEIMNAGGQVITSINRLGVPAIEGYVSLWSIKSNVGKAPIRSKVARKLRK